MQKPKVNIDNYTSKVPYCVRLSSSLTCGNNFSEEVNANTKPYNFNASLCQWLIWEK